MSRTTFPAVEIAHNCDVWSERGSLFEASADMITATVVNACRLDAFIR